MSSVEVWAVFINPASEWAVMSTDGYGGTISWRPADVRRSLAQWTLTPRRIALLYLLFGIGALLASDLLLVRAVDDPLLARLQALKGVAEVLLTAGLVYALTRRSRRQLRERNTALRRQREELDVLHRLLRHNLRNALTVVVGTTDHLDEDDVSEEMLAECRGRTQDAVARIVDLIEQASRVRRVTENDQPLVEVDLVQTVTSVVEDHRAITDDVEVRTDLPAAAPVAVNRMFEEALAELIENAVVHNDGDSQRLAIRIDPDAGEDEVGLSVADDGPGLAERQRRVFERRELDQLVHLDGMGLWFAYWTVTDGGGSFDITDNEWGGTTVRLGLPTPDATADARRGLTTGPVGPRQQ